MNRFLSILFVAAVMLASCTKVTPADEAAVEPEVTVIEAWQEGDATKAIYDGSHINWEEGDALTVFPAGSSNGVKFVKKSGDNNLFTAEGAVALNSSYALYPYYSAANMSGGKINTVIKSAQTATPGSFAPDANVAVGFCADGKTVQFRNAVSYIKVSYKTARTDVSVRRIIFQTLDGTALSGRFALTPVVRSGVVTDVTLSPLSGAMNSVSLTGDIRPNTDYYIVVPPVNLSAGYRIVFEDGNGKRFSKDYTAAKNKARLVRNSISATGLKNIDKYEISVEAYWRVTSADEFTGDNDKYLLVKNTAASQTGYRVFDESKTDVFISTGQPLVDKFAGGTITGLSSKLSSWKTGGSAPLFMSHYVLYCFRDAYSDDGLQFGPNASELILNPDDAYAFTVSTDAALGKVVNFNLCYKHSGAQSTPVTLTNCYLDAAGDNSFKLYGKITQTSIDGLVDVFFLSKGDQFKAAVSQNDIHSGADRSVNAYSQTGFCTTEITTTDERTTMNNCFMIRNYYLCNYPMPGAILVYKKASRQLTLAEYYRLFNNN